MWTCGFSLSLCVFLSFIFFLSLPRSLSLCLFLSLSLYIYMYTSYHILSYPYMKLVPETRSIGEIQFLHGCAGLFLARWKPTPRPEVPRVGSEIEKKKQTSQKRIPEVSTIAFVCIVFRKTRQWVGLIIYDPESILGLCEIFMLCLPSQSEYPLSACRNSHAENTRNGVPWTTFGGPGAPKVVQTDTEGRMHLTFRNVRFSLIAKCQVHPPLGAFLDRFWCPRVPKCAPGALIWIPLAPFGGPATPNVQ